MLVIVPDFPPNLNGIGDYAYLLAKELRQKNRYLKIEFLVAGKNNYPITEYDSFKIYNLEEKNANSLYDLLKILNPNLIHLHYVGYGYNKRGIPFWLYLGLTNWKRIEGNILVTTFHELYANSKIPWTSSFWNQLLQKYICKKIYLISNSVFTSNESFKNVLVNFNPFIDVSVFPVFSNFGEINNINTVESRKKGLIVLGSIDTRFIVYKKFQKELNIISQNFAITQIIDIGPKFDKLPKLNVPIIELGVLDPNQISTLLSKNSFGIIAGHSSDFFAKSGVFSAYAAHGIVVFALNVNFSKIEDGLNVNHHFITINSVDINYNLISNTVYKWYNNHTLQKQCVAYSNIFNKYIF
jgi:hypothetical protein